MGIDTILLSDAGGVILAKITGGGFLAGDFLEVLLDVTAPPFTNMIWNERNRSNELEASFELVDPKFP